MKRNRDVSYRRNYRPDEQQKKRKKRNIATIGMIIVVLFGLFFVSQTKILQRQYLLVSILVLAGALLPVLILFEYRRPQAREVVLLSVMTALCVGVNVLCSHTIPLHAGTTLVILAGIALGPEAGFLVGALGRLVCNFYDGQGPWTPWQMLTWGLLGLLAGLLFYRAVRRGDNHEVRNNDREAGDETNRSRKLSYTNSIVCMTIYTFVSVFIIYGGVMNLAAWFMNHAMNPADSPLTREALIAVYAAGVPYDFMHAAGAALCMFLFGDALLQKIRRVQIKFGIYME